MCASREDLQRAVLQARVRLGQPVRLGLHARAATHRAAQHAARCTTHTARGHVCAAPVAAHATLTATNAAPPGRARHAPKPRHTSAPAPLPHSTCWYAFTLIQLPHSAPSFSSPIQLLHSSPLGEGSPLGLILPCASLWTLSSPLCPPPLEVAICVHGMGGGGIRRITLLRPGE